MYTCSLPGCKSAWGDSDSMANHLCGNKQKHNKNYIMYHMKDPRGACLTKDQVMYHFISGYTAKVAGTEEGVKEPEATFSACFGAPPLV